MSPKKAKRASPEFEAWSKLIRQAVAAEGPRAELDALRAEVATLKQDRDEAREKEDLYGEANSEVRRHLAVIGIEAPFVDDCAIMAVQRIHREAVRADAAESALSASQAEARGLAEHVEMLVKIIDNAGRFAFSNGNVSDAGVDEGEVLTWRRVEEARAAIRPLGTK